MVDGLSTGAGPTVNQGWSERGELGQNNTTTLSTTY
jgi:hypothetical protein